MDDYNEVINLGIADTLIGVGDKLTHPVLVDMGVTNFKMATAIRLLQDYQQEHVIDDPLGLSDYYDNYVALN